MYIKKKGGGQSIFFLTLTRKRIDILPLPAYYSKHGSFQVHVHSKRKKKYGLTTVTILWKEKCHFGYGNLFKIPTDMTEGPKKFII